MSQSRNKVIKKVLTLKDDFLEIHSKGKILIKIIRRTKLIKSKSIKSRRFVLRLRIYLSIDLNYALLYQPIPEEIKGIRKDVPVY